VNQGQKPPDLDLHQICRTILPLRRLAKLAAEAQAETHSTAAVSGK
jgi:hypothetical protein